MKTAIVRRPHPRKPLYVGFAFSCEPPKRFEGALQAAQIIQHRQCVIYIHFLSVADYYHSLFVGCVGRAIKNQKNCFPIVRL